MSVWVALFCFAVLAFSPVRNVGDSRYTLVVSETLLHHGTIHLDRWFLPTEKQSSWEQSYHVREVNGHVDYVFPSATSLLSLPFSAAFNLAGSRVVEHGQYRFDRESWQQHKIACLLMSGLAVGMYLTARCALPQYRAAAFVIAAVPGSQIWSVASRGLWSHTPAIFLLGWSLFLAVRCETSEDRARTVHPVLLATLLSWSFFCRPTFAIAIIGITAWMLLRCRRQLVPFAVTGLLWFCGFLWFSQVTCGQLLPWYFSPSRVSSGPFREALTGNLVSPARGILVYTPVVIVIAWQAVRHAWRSRLRWLSLVGAGCIIAHTLVVSRFPHWWAGHSYGPRLMTDLVPWWFLIAVAAWDGCQSRVAPEKPRSFTPRMVVAYGLLIVSILMNAAGALSGACSHWSVSPSNVDEHPERLWDWSDPPFLRPIHAT